MLCTHTRNNTHFTSALVISVVCHTHSLMKFSNVSWKQQNQQIFTLDIVCTVCTPNSLCLWPMFWPNSKHFCVDETMKRIAEFPSTLLTSVSFCCAHWIANNKRKKIWSYCGCNCHGAIFTTYLLCVLARTQHTHTTFVIWQIFTVYLAKSLL